MAFKFSLVDIAAIVLLQGLQMVQLPRPHRVKVLSSRAIFVAAWTCLSLTLPSPASTGAPQLP